MVGSSVLNAAQDNFLTPAQFAQLTYVAGTSTDTIWVRASDGIQYGAWPNGVTVIDAPVVTPVSATVTVSHQNPVAATSLFTASDADGDNLTQSPAQYDFWDNGIAGGTWLQNGIALKLGTDNFVNASQLSQITYRGGAGSRDDMGARQRRRPVQSLGFSQRHRHRARGRTGPERGERGQPQDLCGLEPVHCQRRGWRQHRSIRCLEQRRWWRALDGWQLGAERRAG
jgi:hypothetical protein